MKPKKEVIERFAILLQDYLGDRSVLQVAAEAGITHQAIHNILQRRASFMRESTIKVLCAALGKDPAPLIRIRNEAYYTDRDTAIIALVNKGGKLQAVGDIYGIGRERVRQIVGDNRASFMCRYCGKKSLVMYGRTEFCRKKCKVSWDKIMQHYIKFFRHIDFTPDGNGCLNWKAYVHPSGYGMVRRNGSLQTAQHTMWELTRGSIPRGKQVRNKCGNKHCCNPDHLYIGTQADNAKIGIHGMDEDVEARDEAMEGARR